MGRGRVESLKLVTVGSHRTNADDGIIEMTCRPVTAGQKAGARRTWYEHEEHMQHTT